MEVQYHRVENVKNSSMAVSNIRVAKINRNQHGLRGNLTFLKDIGNNYLLFTEIYHSSLGNNQFTRTPYKLPILGICDFNSYMLNEYRDYLEDVIENLPLDNECPIGARVLVVKDVIFDSNAWPQQGRPGLWKVEMKIVEALTSTNILELHFYINVYDY
uniref:Uncharacterized protein n=1 Tax=Anopheles quadriannulatus TaxID=34691 RepID=A0A182X2I2_ANOQN